MDTDDAESITINKLVAGDAINVWNKVWKTIERKDSNPNNRRFDVTFTDGTKRSYCYGRTLWAIRR